MSDTEYKCCTICNTKNTLDMLHCTLCENRSFLDTVKPIAGGIKHNKGKAPITLIPTVAIWGMARVFAMGIEKYGKHNYRKGLKFRECLDAAIRHILDLQDCDDIDKESGENHVFHALCELAMYAFMMKYRPDLDDRYDVKMLMERGKDEKAKL